MAKNSGADSTSKRSYARPNLTHNGVHGTAALALVSSEVIAKTLLAVLNAGDAILVGTTRDGGAVAIQVYSEDRVDKLYAATLEELQELLTGIMQVANS